MAIRYEPMPGHICAFEDFRSKPPVWRLGMVAKVDHRGRVCHLIASGEKAGLSVHDKTDCVRTIPDSRIRNLASRLANREAIGKAYPDADSLRAAIMALA